jgi:hypothetical protein
MPATVSGSKVVTMDPGPTRTAAGVTALFAKAPENFTVGDMQYLLEACVLKQTSENPSTVVGSLFT